jgi:threonine/homoserine/homoserine lactone efflux protein
MNSIVRGIILGLSITAPIGPTNIEIIRRGTKGGWRAAMKFSLGVMIALILYLTLVTFGLTFFTQSPTIHSVLTLVGVVVLLYLAYHSIKDFFTGRELNLEGQQKGEHHFISGVILTLANPAVLLLWTGIMGADLASQKTTSHQGFLLSAGILIGVSTFFTALNILLHFSRRILHQKYFRFVSLAAGLVLLYFCIRFAWELLLRFT